MAMYMKLSKKKLSEMLIECNKQLKSLCEVKSNTINVKSSAFTITINDGFCTWEYGFDPKNARKLCIDNLAKALSDKFKAVFTYSKCID